MTPPAHHTRWTLVAAARGGGAAPVVELSQRYWYAAYAFLRRSGVAADAAHELTQRFFARLTSERLHALDSRSNQRFREFVLAELRELANDGPLAAPVGVAPQGLVPPLPRAALEQRYVVECADCASAEAAFERAFSETIVTRSMERLRAEAESAGRGALFAQLRPYLASEPDAAQQAEIGRALGVRPMVVVLGLRSLRHRLRQLVADELQGADGDPGAERRTLRIPPGG